MFAWSGTVYDQLFAFGNPVHHRVLASERDIYSTADVLEFEGVLRPAVDKSGRAGVKFEFGIGNIYPRHVRIGLEFCKGFGRSAGHREKGGDKSGQQRTGKEQFHCLFVSESSKHFIGMISNVNLVKYFYDLAGVDQKCLSHSAHVLFAINAFFTPYIVFLDDLFVRICDQGVRQVIFRDKFLMRLFAVDRNADDLDIQFIESFARITERTRFFRSAGRVVFGIKPQYDTFVIKVFEAHRIAILITGLKIRCLIAYFQHNIKCYRSNLWFSYCNTLFFVLSVPERSSK